MVQDKEIYNNILEKDLQKLLSTINANTLVYKNGQTIAYSLSNRNLIGIIEDGSANVIRFDYNGDRTIVENLDQGDIFSGMFFSSDSSELIVMAASNCEVTLINYDELFKKVKTNNTAVQLVDNIFKKTTKFLKKRNERIELLTTRSIRNKLLAYFELESKKSGRKTFNLNYSYTDLADYLAIDRSAMMRELKNLKDEGFIQDINKKITILY